MEKLSRSVLTFCLRNKPWTGDSWSGRRPEAPIRHLGQHRQRGLQDGLLWSDGTDPSDRGHGQDSDGRWLFVRVQGAHVRQRKGDAHDVLHQHAFR